MADGETLDLRNYYIVFTSNIGAADIMNLQHSTHATMERHVLIRAQQSMRPELFARITEKMVFNRLSYDTQLEIAKLLLDGEIEFLRDKGHHLTPEKGVLQFLVQRGFHPRLGARPMRDTIERLIGEAVVANVLATGSANGTLATNPTGVGLQVSQAA
jgi:ATP-dependent Clp protease ATP-binding subunit ClpB